MRAGLGRDARAAASIPQNAGAAQGSRAATLGYNDFSIVVTSLDTVTEPRTWMCLICGWIYDEAAGDPEHGIAPGTAWADVPMNWTCPECGARKEDFEMVPV